MLFKLIIPSAFIGGVVVAYHHIKTILNVKAKQNNGFDLLRDQSERASRSGSDRRNDALNADKSFDRQEAA